jgi:hypothetical protein
MKCLLTNISRLPVIAATIALTATPALACSDDQRVVIETIAPFSGAHATAMMIGEDADHVVEVRIENGETTVIVDGEQVAQNRFRTENGEVIVLDEDGNEIKALKLFMDGGDHDFVFGLPGGKEGLRWQLKRPHANVMLGVHLADPGAALRKHLRLEPGEGSMIGGLFKGLPAERAGLQQYDVIVAIDGEPVDDHGTIMETLTAAEAGDEVTLSVVQNGRHKQFTVTLDAFDAAKMNPANMIGGGGGAMLRFGIPNMEFKFAPGEDFEFKRFLVDPDKKDLFVPDTSHFRRWRSNDSELDDERLEHLNERMAELHKMIDRLVKEARQRED